MIVLMHTGGVAMTNCYLVVDEGSGEAVLFDAPDHTVRPLLDEVERRRWKLKGLWLTHGHFDHFADHAEVRKRFPEAEVRIHPLDEAKARQPEMQTRLFGLPLEIPPLEAPEPLEDGQKLRIGNLEVTVIHTPGHSPGHVGFYIESEATFIGGDLIIGGSVGRTDLPDSDHSDLERSIRSVMKLPGATRLLGGHGGETTLGGERRQNYFVQEVLKGC